ncbi:hypothetical protein DOTSEDRAFT_34560 [Dothistroma septosporum NZE10]|uniref:Uncharacterized protein n=1 Tax=Dothistroma septosporum (strain NZE10 / CBS 128990) TaxID=675120 RepID=N1PLY2_DOTSN|nr:hypothetical protein DOTSEDRAFT_34560 [Dothistroma septosporum NZE10]
MLNESVEVTCQRAWTPAKRECKTRVLLGNQPHQEAVECRQYLSAMVDEVPRVNSHPSTTIVLIIEFPRDVALLETLLRTCLLQLDVLEELATSNSNIAHQGKGKIPIALQLGIPLFEEIVDGTRADRATERIRRDGTRYRMTRSVGIDETGQPTGPEAPRSA